MVVSFWMKVLGSVCTMAGASGCGIWMSGQYRQRLRLLERLRQMIFLLKGQIVYANATLEEAFMAVGERTEGSLGQLFVRVAGQLGARPGDPFFNIWQEAVNGLGREVPLAAEDKQSLAAMGEHLGFLDCSAQERNLLLYLEELDLVIGELRSRQQERCRLYTSLGVLGGMFLTILLC